MPDSRTFSASLLSNHITTGHASLTTGRKFRLMKGDYPSSGLLIIPSTEVLISRQGAAGVEINNIHGVIDDIVPSPLGYEITVDAGDIFYADITHREMLEQKFVTGEQVIISFRT
jgi:hypothetical protein